MPINTKQYPQCPLDLPYSNQSIPSSHIPYGSSPSAPSRSPCRSCRISARIWRSAKSIISQQSISTLLQNKIMFSYPFDIWYDYNLGAMRKPFRVIWKRIAVTVMSTMFLGAETEIFSRFYTELWFYTDFSHSSEAVAHQCAVSPWPTLSSYDSCPRSTSSAMHSAPIAFNGYCSLIS